MGHYILQLLIAIDQLINAILGGWADETLSSRSYRLANKNSVFGMFARLTIDSIFFWQENHCQEAYNSEREDRHLPPELRDA